MRLSLKIFFRRFHCTTSCLAFSDSLKWVMYYCCLELLVYFKQEILHAVLREVRVLLHPQVHLHAVQVQEPLYSGR